MTPISSLTVHVRCSGQRHGITLSRGRLRFSHHQLTSLRLSRLLGTPIRCAAILEAISSGAVFTPASFPIPRPLRITLEDHIRARHTLGHSRGFTPLALQHLTREQSLARAVARRHRRLIDRFRAGGLHVEPDVRITAERIAVHLRGGTILGLSIASWTCRQWVFNYKNIEELAVRTLGERTAAHPFWGSGLTCRVCRHTYAVTHRYPFTVAAHATTQKHHKAVMAATTAATVREGDRTESTSLPPDEIPPADE